MWFTHWKNTLNAKSIKKRKKMLTSMTEDNTAMTNESIQ